jgi:four helix bundle protein
VSKVESESNGLQKTDPGRLSNKEFAKELEARARKFAVRIIKLSGKLPNTIEGKVIRNQITKSGTSVGANYREANRSRSRADFKSRIKICESEASETQYWMEVIEETGWLTRPQIKGEFEECTELLAIFNAIGKNI